MSNIIFGPGTAFGAGITFQIPTTTYTVTPASGSINEGTGLTFTVGGTYIPNGTYYWTVNNVTTSGGDFSAASGSFSITSNAGTFTVTPVADVTTEGAETFTVSIRSVSISGTILATCSSTTVNDTSTAPLLYKAIFGYGQAAITNLVSNTGVVANDVAGVGTARYGLAAAGYGGDKAIFGYGQTGPSAFSVVSMTNLVSNTGVVGNDVTGVGAARGFLMAAGYGTDKAIFGYGYNSFMSQVSTTNLVSNTGVVGNNVTGVGTGRSRGAAAGYGSDKAIFGYGDDSNSYFSMTNLVSNTGVVATNTTGVGTNRSDLAAAGYGTDKAIFGYGTSNSGAPNYINTKYSLTNKVSNTGVVATDTTGVGTARVNLAAAGYGVDKAIFGYGYATASVSMTNLVSNTGVVATDTTGVGTARTDLAAASYGAA